MVTRLAEDVWWYDLTGVNAYLVDDGGTLTLVDTGNPWDGRRVVLGVTDAGYAVTDVERVLLTHYDFDHVGGLAQVHGLDATVYVGAADAPLVRGTERPPLGNHKGLLQAVSSPFVGVPDCPVETVADGDEIGSFTVYHTPGHTPGHVAYISEDLSTAFLGDMVREASGELHASPWVMSYDTARVTESVRDFAARTPEFAVAAMGHGTPFSRRGSERIANLAASLA
ncbi:MBL fold metallo-hydrolase [Halorientalis litorea]|uniref:MBL fold metallo-hydrolase n=1 Tax=Halorientalis litorea TaxID=2931977 RepID=UPI001FF325D1|nr:MBL fold metallo-hydrolase [Halorientalis litorea]